MLSDEEKKAIEHLKIVAKERTIKPLDDEIGTVLNLIEKQSKEIEGLIKVSKECIEEKFNNDKKWEDKIKAKIEDILNSENSEAIQKLIEWQSLLEKE